MFEGMSDDEEEFQSVSHTLWYIRNIQRRTSDEMRRPERDSVLMFVTGEPGRSPQQSRGLGRNASGVSEPQRCDGPSADNAERAGDGFGSRQHSRQQRCHSNNLKPGQSFIVRTKIQIQWKHSCPLLSFRSVCLHSRPTPLAVWPRCQQGPQSVTISSARLCNKLCKPPTCPLCRWSSELTHLIHSKPLNHTFLSCIFSYTAEVAYAELKMYLPLALSLVFEGLIQWMCLCVARAAGSPRCSSSGTWGSRMRNWCWERCRPQMVTSRLPWSSSLLAAQGCEPRAHRPKLLQTREQACQKSVMFARNERPWI